MTATNEAKQRIEAWVRSLGTNGQAPTLLDLANLLESEAALRQEKIQLRTALKNARRTARESGIDVQKFAEGCDIGLTQLIKWTSGDPAIEPSDLRLAALLCAEMEQQDRRQVADTDFFD